MKRLNSLVMALSICSGPLLLTDCDETEISVLTYNIGGLPKKISKINPEKNIPKISSLLNDYDLVLIQENFIPDYNLFAETKHPFHLPENLSVENKNGLSRLSSFQGNQDYQERWFKCSGLMKNYSDCLAPKGFSVSEQEVIPGIWIDVYNLHMDSGDLAEDQTAREAQINQLVNFINLRSQYKAVIVAGDTNLKLADEYLFERLLSEGRLNDSCKVLNCPDPYSVDKILYRSSPWINLKPTEWYIPPTFVDEKGKALSDHNPVTVNFTISTGNF